MSLTRAIVTGPALWASPVGWGSASVHAGGVRCGLYTLMGACGAGVRRSMHRGVDGLLKEDGDGTVSEVASKGREQVSGPFAS